MFRYNEYMERKRTVEILKALADETRLGIVKKLADEERCMPSCDLVNTCASTQQLSQPAMSHHFNRLVEVGVVLEEKRGTQKSIHAQPRITQSRRRRRDKIINNQ